MASGKARGGTERKRAPRQPDATRQAVLDSAVKLFGANGYHATSVQSIVDAAGVTKGAFYHHFASKEDVLRNLHDTFIDYQLERAHDVLDRDLDPAETLRLFISDVLLEPVARYKSEMTIFFDERRNLSGSAFKQLKRKRDEFERCVVEVVERGISAGIFHRVDSPRLLGFAVIGMCAWAYHWLDPGGEQEVDRIADLYADSLLHGLLKS